VEDMESRKEKGFIGRAWGKKVKETREEEGG